MSRRNKKTSKKVVQKATTPNLSDLFSKCEFKEEEYLMYYTKTRLESFNNWPFDEECSCNPNSLSEAGFYHIPTDENPDATRCFVCYKELDGWEPEDDPKAEHRKHSSHCAYLSLKKPIDKLTIDEFLKLECERQKNKLRKIHHTKTQEWETGAAHVRSEMMKLNPNTL